MTSTPVELGAALDTWNEKGRAGIVETIAAVTVSRLDAESARQLLVSVIELGWECELHDQAGEPAELRDISDDFGPFIATVQKDVDGADRRLLTRTGLIQALSENNSAGQWQIACAETAFATGTISFSPWGRGDVFAPAATTKSPLDIVREASESRLVPTDIRKWLVRGDVSATLWKDQAFQAFSIASAPSLIRSLASEVIGQGNVIFNGPPRLNLTLKESDLLNELGLEGYKNLQSAVAWVYEHSVSAEQKHALFAAEFSRSVTRSERIGTVFRTSGRDILDGARLAFQMSQSDLSREAIKAQGDLRKTIADDMAKAAEGTRTLSGAVAVAIATGITLIAARSTGTAEPWVLSLVAGVVSVYLATVAISGWAYLRLQGKLRDQWRQRFYRFVPADDYEAMVTNPAKSAERPYHFVAAIALVVAAALAYMAMAILASDPKQETPNDTADKITSSSPPSNPEMQPPIAGPEPKQ